MEVIELSTLNTIPSPIENQIFSMKVGPLSLWKHAWSPFKPSIHITKCNFNSLIQKVICLNESN
jgi:hypothetical protein